VGQGVSVVEDLEECVAKEAILEVETRMDFVSW